MRTDLTTALLLAGAALLLAGCASSTHVDETLATASPPAKPQPVKTVEPAVSEPAADDCPRWRALFEAGKVEEVPYRCLRATTRPKPAPAVAKTTAKP